MSYTGQKTPLQLNVEAGLNSGTGLRVNPDAASWHGVWTAATPYKTPTAAGYTQGQLTNSTVLQKLTEALPNFYNLTPGTLCVRVWRNLLTIGRPVNNPTINCPALGNCRPDTFVGTWAGYGSFKSGSTVDEYGNTVPSSGLGLVDPAYPPKEYPSSGLWSYVYNNWGSTTPTPGWPTDCNQNVFSPYTDPANYYQPYAWITGWPGAYAWQSKAAGNPQTALDPVADGDSYAAAYYPRPDLASTQSWRSRDLGKIEYDEYFRYGFLATVARQAYYEFWSGKTGRRPNQYPEFIKGFQGYATFASNANSVISSYTNTKNFIRGNYSNINDLTSSDFAGVTLAFKDFGNDMVRLGKTLDLQNIHVFGLPSKFLLNLQRHNALTPALRLALLYSDLTVAELSDILLPTYTPGVDQEAKIYAALGLIAGADLNDILVITNCATSGLQTLADLINPAKMFPNSYRSLTIPEYSTATTSSKIYKFIYNGVGVNTSIRDWGGYLAGILPADLALACGAFMMTMNQVKNIRQMECEKVSQVITNLEVVDKGLPDINSPNSTPGNVGLADGQLALTALGSGVSGTWRCCDFYGAISGVPYVDWYSKAQELILKLQTPTLANIYIQLYNYSVSGVFTSAQIQALIDAANAEIAAITASNPVLVAELNSWWNKIGKQLAIEQRGIPYAAPQASDTYSEAGPAEISSFVSTIETYALDTSAGGQAPVLEAISDITGVTGQSLVASLREARNAKRLVNTGGDLDNAVSSEPGCPCPVTATVSGGVVVSISTTGIPTGYNPAKPPNITILPQGGVFGPGSGSGAAAVANVNSLGEVESITVTAGGAGYTTPPTVYIDCPPSPERLGGPLVPGSFAGSPWTGGDPVPDNLVTGPDASYTVDSAIQVVTKCNCDCWN